jgi:hypothetical protein
LWQHLKDVILFIGLNNWGGKMKEASSIYFKNHTERRISEIQERIRNFKAEKIKERMRKNFKMQKRARGRKKRKLQ